jgi:hypothetical protein
VDWDRALLQALDLGDVDIDAHNVIAGLGETRAGHESDVA